VIDTQYLSNPHWLALVRVFLWLEIAAASVVWSGALSDISTARTQIRGLLGWHQPLLKDAD
jgi:hypothetical protein